MASQKTLRIIVGVFVFTIPLLNSLVTFIYTLVKRFYKHSLYAFILLSVLVCCLMLDTPYRNHYYVNKYNVDSIEDLLVITSDHTIPIYHPEYSLIDTDMVDGEHELKLLENGLERIHEIEVSNGRYEKYMVYDRYHNLIEDRFKVLLKQQIDNFKYANPEKIIVEEYKLMDTPFMIIGIIFMLLTGVHTFWVLVLGQGKVDESIPRFVNNVTSDFSVKAIFIRQVVEEDTETIEVVSARPIDINKATVYHFTTIKGVSLDLAKCFIEEREANGNYNSLDNFFQRNDIYKMLQNDLRPHLVVDMV